MSASNKRSRSPNEQSDDDDLTVDKLEDFFDPSLTDRQRMSWALQTEQRVRLAKLEGRDSGGGGSSARSTTLRSKYLFDLYPTIDDELMKSSGRKDILFLDFLKFRRKCRPELAVARPPDASFDETLIHLDIGSHEMDPNAVQQQQQGEVTAVPPNMLYFEILLEAFMGYKFPRYSPPSSSSLPKAAVMGGAIVAVLTSWRQSKVSDQIEADFASMNIKYAWWSDCKDDPTNLSTSKETIKDYLDWKTDMISTLREHFLYHGDDRQEQHGDDDESGGREHDESSSAFATGDVDIFLQPSTVTRNLVQALTAHGLTSDLQGHIESYMGGMGFAQNELYRASKQLCWDIKKNVKEFPGQKAYGYYCHGGNEVGVLVFALTRHALSFICGARDDGEKAAFPRTTQMILLHEDADLVGALMDFDISVACCAYDGTNVWIAPRAALSLCTLTQVVTPFVLEEKRNRRRIIKYFKRGFKPLLLDPNWEGSLEHLPATSLASNTGWQDAQYQPDRQLDPLDITRNTHWRCGDLQPNIYYDVIDYQFENTSGVEFPRLRDLSPYSGGEDPPSDKRLVCCCTRRAPVYYSIALFEKETGDGLRFLSQRHGWSDEWHDAVNKVHPYMRMACRPCRQEYASHLLLSKTSYPESTEDSLRGDVRFSYSGDYYFAPSFYAGGVFHARLVGIVYYKLLSHLISQSHAERIRYFLEHQSLQGYVRRFVFGADLSILFDEAAELTLSKPSRSPVGLNPERFVAKCRRCREWLVGYKYNKEYCENCEDRKPSASAT